MKYKTTVSDKKKTKHKVLSERLNKWNTHSLSVGQTQTNCQKDIKKKQPSEAQANYQREKTLKQLNHKLALET